MRKKVRGAYGNVSDASPKLGAGANLPRVETGCSMKGCLRAVCKIDGLLFLLYHSRNKCPEKADGFLREMEREKGWELERC